MSTPQYLQMDCASCRNGIEFPAEGLGQTVDCPHCGRPALLRCLPPSVGKPKREQDPVANPDPNTQSASEPSAGYFYKATCRNCDEIAYMHSSDPLLQNRCDCGGWMTLIKVPPFTADDLPEPFRSAAKIKPDDNDTDPELDFIYRAWCPTCGESAMVYSVEESDGDWCDCGGRKIYTAIPDPLELVSCPKCRASVRRRDNVCPQCHSQFTPDVCDVCGANEFQVVSPSKPVLLDTNGLTGILATVAAGAMSDAMFPDQYFCTRCGTRGA